MMKSPSTPKHFWMVLPQKILSHPTSYCLNDVIMLHGKLKLGNYWIFLSMFYMFQTSFWHYYSLLNLCFKISLVWWCLNNYSDLSGCYCLVPTCVWNLMLTYSVPFAPSHHSSQSHFLLLLLLLTLSSLSSSLQLYHVVVLRLQEGLLGWVRENYDSRKTREAACAKLNHKTLRVISGHLFFPLSSRPFVGV